MSYISWNALFPLTIPSNLNESIVESQLYAGKVPSFSTFVTITGNIFSFPYLKSNVGIRPSTSAHKYMWNKCDKVERIVGSTSNYSELNDSGDQAADSQQQEAEETKPESSTSPYGRKRTRVQELKSPKKFFHLFAALSPRQIRKRQIRQLLRWKETIIWNNRTDHIVPWYSCGKPGYTAHLTFSNRCKSTILVFVAVQVVKVVGNLLFTAVSLGSTFYSHQCLKWMRVAL